MSKESVAETIQAITSICNASREHLASAGVGSAAEFMESAAYAELVRGLRPCLHTLSTSDLQAVRTGIDVLRHELCGGRRPAELSADEMEEYLRLGDAKLVLDVRHVQCASDDAFIRWVTEQCLQHGAGLVASFLFSRVPGLVDRL